MIKKQQCRTEVFGTAHWLFCVGRRLVAVDNIFYPISLGFGNVAFFNNNVKIVSPLANLAVSIEIAKNTKSENRCGTETDLSVM